MSNIRENIGSYRMKTGDSVEVKWDNSAASYYLEYENGEKIGFSQFSDDMLNNYSKNISVKFYNKGYIDIWIGRPDKQPVNPNRYYLIKE